MASTSDSAVSVGVASIAVASIVFGVLLVLQRKTSQSPAKFREAAFVAIALVALIIQSAVVPNRWGVRGTSKESFSAAASPNVVNGAAALVRNPALPPPPLTKGLPAQASPASPAVPASPPIVAAAVAAAALKASAAKPQAAAAPPPAVAGKVAPAPAAAAAAAMKPATAAPLAKPAVPAIVKVASGVTAKPAIAPPKAVAPHPVAPPAKAPKPLASPPPMPSSKSPAAPKSATASVTKSPPLFAATASAYSITPEQEALSALPKSLRVYVTTLSAASFGSGGGHGAGKTWANVAPGSSRASSACSSSPSMDFHFAQTPTFLSPEAGLGLGDNMLSGPQSHQLGIDGDGSYTVAVVFQPSGPIPSLDEASVFKIFANSSGSGKSSSSQWNNNGFSLSMRSHASSSSSADVYLQVGNAQPVQSKSPVSFDPHHRYLLVASRDRGSMSASLVDLDQSTNGYAKSPIVGPVPVPSGTPRVSFANVDMTVNGSGNWNANVLAIGVYAEALGDGVLNDLYRHYTATLREYDPAHAEIKAQLEAARVATSCPYDDPTCAQCGGVKEWSAASAALVTSGGPSCLAAIDRFCAANPRHARCSCWDTSSPEYGRSCSAYRAVFSGKAYDITGCPAPDARPPPPPNAAQTLDSVITSVLSPHNVEAVTRLIGAVRGGSSSTDKNHHSATHPPARHAGRKKGRSCPHRPRHRRGECPDASDDSDASSDESECAANGGGACPQKNKPGFWSWVFGTDDSAHQRQRARQQQMKRGHDGRSSRRAGRRDTDEDDE